MLTLRHVSTGYGGLDVVKDISLHVENNENLMIIGPNASGKTTLLKAVAGLLPFKGEIEIDGAAIRGMKRRDIARKIAMLGQISGMYFSYSVHDTVMMGRYLHINDRLLGLPSEADRAFVEKCLEAVDILDVRDREITKLSGGQLQRVFLARTLAQDPEIILLDEPTNHLDIKYQFELAEYLKEWSKQGSRAVVGVLHDINLAARLGDRFMIMKEGEALAIGKTEEVLTDALLEQAYDMDIAGYMRSTLGMWEKR
ncbi:MAG: ABC transporter ATP-binding protein [Clostridiales bacterium]|jgi:iron complex transport system ATP-binding protein|nr:ABC transporter ATP-binding protein [Clostridiales bacterium]